MTTVEENKLNFFLKYNTSEARGDRLGCLGVTHPANGVGSNGFNGLDFDMECI